MAGLTINMISLFALIITLGIVVDDAIVVGEHADFRARRLGEDPTTAAENAARRMFFEQRWGVGRTGGKGSLLSPMV